MEVCTFSLNLSRSGCSGFLPQSEDVLVWLTSKMLPLCRAHDHILLYSMWLWCFRLFVYLLQHYFRNLPEGLSGNPCSVMKCLCKQTCSHSHASNPFIVQLQWQWLNCIVTKVERCTTGRNNKPQWTWYHFLLSGTIDKASTNGFFHLCSFAMLCKSANRELDGESLFELIYSLPVH